MGYQISTLEPGLTLVATPIGRARDITLHALDILASAEVLVAEDTRQLRKLLNLHAIPLAGRPIISYHDHNGDKTRPAILNALKDGKSVAFTSDAGTPLIADPGYDLAIAAREAGHRVTMAPGPVAAIMGLALSGLPCDKFLFAGFLPPTLEGRRKALLELREAPASLVFYESPKRIAQTLEAMVQVFGEDRLASIGRELTKKFEQTLHGTLGHLRQEVQAMSTKGEIVLIVAPPTAQSTVSDADLDATLLEALKTMRIKDAATAVAGALNLPRRVVYQRAISLQTSQ